MENRKALVEVAEVLQHLSAEDLAKIPAEIQQQIAENKDEEYVWKFDETKKLKDQPISRQALGFLAYLNREYLLSEEQRSLMEQMHRHHQQTAEQTKEAPYDPKQLFGQEAAAAEKKGREEERQLVEYKESWLRRVIGRIKAFFR